jgi:2-(1,2-epoxy-1,2-dihydrophenyl)acetyl-CoA isomerase
VRFAAADGVATVTLARARMHNALVPELLLDLCVALETLGRRDDVRAVLLLAEGEAFSIGGDMRRFAQEMAGPDLLSYSAELVGLLNQAVLSLLELPQPVVAGVHGLVTGGSLGLVLAADVVVAARTAQFKAHYATAGFSPDGGWTALLPRLVGTRQAAACLLLNRTLSAPHALARGLVTDLAAPDEVAANAEAAARRIAGSPTATMRNAKRLLWGDLAPVEAALEAERARFIETIGSADARAGVQRFLRDFSGYPGEDAPA